jgi:phosphotransferase system enzyme I (PtsP)
VGNVYVNPSEEIIARFETQNRTRQQVTDRRETVSADTAKTKDGTPISLMANINLLAELPLAKKMGAAGIGLYRTEFPFLIRPSFPSETEQFLVYREVVEFMEHHPVIFRTLDIGGEKTLAYTDAATEQNPELGLRSIRFALAYRDVFEQQIRAILRAAAGSQSLGIMFPLISSLDDFFRARKVVHTCLDRLNAEGLEHNESPLIGMMVELPAVVETMAEFSEEVDFFSIGSNDFVQYMLGVDRSNKQVAEYYRPEHPSVLRALKKVVRTAKDHGRPIGICGEMGHDPSMIPFLLGIGLRQLSIDPQFMPGVHRQLTDLSLPACQEYAKTLLASGSIEGIRMIRDEVEQNGLVRLS